MRRRTVRSLAIGVEPLVAAAEHPPSGLTAEIPVHAADVLAPRTELLRLATVLATTSRPGVHGVAAASLRLTDRAGPFFSPRPLGTLREAPIRAATHMEAG
jgi:hypothetical protein